MTSVSYVAETIMFRTILTSYLSIDEESAVPFNRVLLNKGDGSVIFFFMYPKSCFRYGSVISAPDEDSVTFFFICQRYNRTTGTVTVPSEGIRFYYFFVYCLQI